MAAPYSATFDAILTAIQTKLIGSVIQPGATPTYPANNDVTQTDTPAGQNTIHVSSGNPSAFWIGKLIAIGNEVLTLSGANVNGTLTTQTNVTEIHKAGTTYSIWPANSLALTASNCFVEIPGQPPTPPAGDVMLAIIPEGGTFDQNLLEGGGELQATIQTSVVTRIYQPAQLDAPMVDVQRLTNSSLGVMQYTTGILRALLNWFPKDANLNRLTRNPLLPVATAVSKPDRKLAWFEVQWSLEFDWDLTGS